MDRLDPDSDYAYDVTNPPSRATMTDGMREALRARRAREVYMVTWGWMRQHSAGPFSTVAEAVTECRLRQADDWYWCEPRIERPENIDVECADGLTRAERDVIDELL